MASKTAKAEPISSIPKNLRDAQNVCYTTGKMLGKGGFATCFSADMYHAAEPNAVRRCALKAVKSKVPKNLIQRFRLELAIQSKLRHPHIVKLHRAFTNDDLTYVALELCSNGSLTQMMKTRKFLTMGEIRRFLIQICGSVKYLHERDVVHRDIKAGNIFLDRDMNVKLGDFGLAAIMEPSPEAAGTAQAMQRIRRTTFCGTPNYLAPEILCKNQGHGTSVDIWAIGILAYYLSVGKAPFHSQTREEIYERLRKGEYEWPQLAPEQNEIPEDLKKLVGSILVEETQRPSPDRIVEHDFFRHGFIPERLDTSCLTRRPTSARMGDGPTREGLDTCSQQQDTYNKICCSSKVGPPHALASAADTRRPRSMFLILAKEMSHRNPLEIPLLEGLVYTGGLDAFRKPEQSTISRKPIPHVSTSNLPQAPAVSNVRQTLPALPIAAPVTEMPTRTNIAVAPAPQPLSKTKPLPGTPPPPTENIRPQSMMPAQPESKPSAPPHPRDKAPPVVQILEDKDTQAPPVTRPRTTRVKDRLLSSEETRETPPKRRSTRNSRSRAAQQASAPPSPQPAQPTSVPTSPKERRLAERPRRAVRKREAPVAVPAEPSAENRGSAVAAVTRQRSAATVSTVTAVSTNEATQERAKPRRPALQSNDRSNRVKRRVADIEGSKGAPIVL